jgi:hypothetical protein
MLTQMSGETAHQISGKVANMAVSEAQGAR